MYFISDLADDFASRICFTIYTMSESKEECLSRFDVFDELRDILLLSDFLEHSNDCFICTSMERSVERSSGCGDRRIRIYERRADMCHGRRGTIHLMVGMQ